MCRDPGQQRLKLTMYRGCTDSTTPFICLYYLQVRVEIMMSEEYHRDPGKTRQNVML